MDSWSRGRWTGISDGSGLGEAGRITYEHEKSLVRQEERDAERRRHDAAAAAEAEAELARLERERDGHLKQGRSSVVWASEPFTLSVALKSGAILGIVLGAIYAFWMLNGSTTALIKFGGGGLIAGIAVGAAAYALVKIVQFAIWLLIWALKIGAVLALLYVAWAYVLPALVR